MAMRKTLTGPQGWSVTLDAAEIFPDDPGNGTPVMVYAPFHRGSGTFGRATDTGEVDDARTGGIIEIPERVLRWLEGDTVGEAIDNLFKQGD